MKEQALYILVARDELEKQLKAESEISFDNWNKVIKEDKKLKDKAYQIVEVLDDLSAYRDSLL